MGSPNRQIETQPPSRKARASLEVNTSLANGDDEEKQQVSFFAIFQVFDGMWSVGPSSLTATTTAVVPIALGLESGSSLLALNTNAVPTCTPIKI
jgi:hypothetical protein